MDNRMKILYVSNTRYGRVVYDYLREIESQIVCAKLNNEVIPIFPDYDLGISFLYQHKIPASEFQIPNRWVNFHPAPLPEYRGRNVAYHAIMNGEKKYGATLHYMTPAFDEGELIDVRRFAIDPEETAGELYDRACRLLVDMAKDWLPQLVRSPVSSTKQDSGKARYYSKGSIPDLLQVSETTKQTIRAVTAYPPHCAKICIGSRLFNVIPASPSDVKPNDKRNVPLTGRATTMPKDRGVPWWVPVMAGGESAALAEVVDANFLNDGDVTTAFENALARRVGVAHAVAVTSGTAALSLALLALGIGSGDEVLVPDVTFIATANAVTMTGARPVLVDVDPRTLCMDPDAAARAITPRTRAILPVHISGRAADMPGLLALGAAHGIPVIEDAAEALGSRRFGAFLGTRGVCGCISLSPNKTITTGQGGVIFTNDDAVHARLRELKDQGRPVRGTGGDDTHVSVGYNFKFTNMQAAVGMAQLRTLDERLARLRRHAELYRQHLDAVPGLTLPGFHLDEGEVPQWVDAVSLHRDALLAELESKGIGYRRFWHALHTQAPYRQPDEAFPQASRLVPQSFWLPSSLTLDDEAILRVCAVVADWFARNGKDAP